MLLRNVNNRSAQSAIEYILLTTAVIVIVIALVVKNGPLAVAINNTLKLPANMIASDNAKIHLKAQ
ncbi:MAG: hypothetical protein HQL22_01090 [Candidatus Omnitrophica bacterium]|nr:hypothetical protein [Candidatus Omnitrophota bacterium]